SLYTPFSCSLYRVHRCLPSFPTRRSSDLAAFCISGSMVSMMFCLLLSNQGDDLTGPGGHNIEWLADRVLLGHFPRPVRPPELDRSEEHTSELQSRENLVCRLLLEKKNTPT